MDIIELEYDIAGGTVGGSTAAVRSKEGNKHLHVMVVDKADVTRNAAIWIGMDGLNNTAILGYETSEQYAKEITAAGQSHETPRRQWFTG